MNNMTLIGVLLILVVGFFGYQWWSKAQKRAPATKKMAAPMPAPGLPAAPLPKADATPVYPTVPGQTEEELRAKEPLQERVPASQQQPVTAEGLGPAKVASNLRHPEQMFHQPQGPAPSLQVTDVPAGRASTVSTPMANAQQQMFSPEMAQNGGAFIGNSVFAFDGDETTALPSF